MEKGFVGAWGETEPRGCKIVFIGKKLDRAFFEESFDACLVRIQPPLRPYSADLAASTASAAASAVSATSSAASTASTATPANAAATNAAATAAAANAAATAAAAAAAAAVAGVAGVTAGASKGVGSGRPGGLPASSPDTVRLDSLNLQPAGPFSLLLSLTASAPEMLHLLAVLLPSISVARLACTCATLADALMGEVGAEGMMAAAATAHAAATAKAAAAAAEAAVARDATDAEKVTAAAVTAPGAKGATRNPNSYLKPLTPSPNP